jgi:hypothetical protein
MQQVNFFSRKKIRISLALSNYLKRSPADAAVLVKPFTVEDIKQGIEKIIYDNELQKNLLPMV